MESALALSLKAPTWIVKLPLPEMGAPGPLTGFTVPAGAAFGGAGRGTAATVTGGAAGALVGDAAAVVTGGVTARAARPVDGVPPLGFSRPSSVLSLSRRWA